MPFAPPQKQEALRRLAAGVAHRYNNLLTSMLFGAGIALNNIAPDHPAHEALEIALSAVQRAAELTRQLMAYAGVKPIVASRVNSTALLRELVASIGPSLPDRVQIRLNLASNVYAVCDFSLEQVVRALITNAMEAIGNNAGAVWIRARAVQNGNFVPSASDATYVQIHISDTGCGMDESTKSRVFEPFFSTKCLGKIRDLPPRRASSGRTAASLQLKARRDLAPPFACACQRGRRRPRLGREGPGGKDPDRR